MNSEAIDLSEVAELSVDMDNLEPRMCPLPDGSREIEIMPPEEFNEVQLETWYELYDTFNDARVISYADLPAFNLLVISYTDIMRKNPDEGVNMSKLRVVYGMLGKFGCLPSERNVTKVPLPPEASMDEEQMDMFARSDDDFAGL